MRICLISSHFLPVPVEVWGGIESQVAVHAAGLRALGHDVHVMTVGSTSRLEEMVLEGVVYHRLGQAAGISNKASIGLMSSAARFTARARERCREINAEIVHFHTRYPCYIGLRRGWWGGRSGSPTVYHAHNWKRAERMSYAPLSLRRAAVIAGAWIDKGIVARCDHVVAISEFMKKEIVDTGDVAASRVSVVTNAVDRRVFTPDTAEPRSREIMFVGRIAAEKGVDTLIEAMQGVLRSYPDVCLRIIGPAKAATEQGAYERHCRALVDRMGLRASVRFQGVVPNRELPSFLRRARVLVVPSVWGEPCGVVVLEGMACGTPVIGSRVGGIPELIEEERTGLLVSPRDPVELEQAILRLMGDDHLCAEAAKRGPELIQARHSWEAIGDRLEGVYRHLMNSERK